MSVSPSPVPSGIPFGPAYLSPDYPVPVAITPDRISEIALGIVEARQTIDDILTRYTSQVFTSLQEITWDINKLILKIGEYHNEELNRTMQPYSDCCCKINDYLLSRVMPTFSTVIQLCDRCGYVEEVIDAEQSPSTPCPEKAEATSPGDNTIPAEESKSYSPTPYLQRELDKWYGESGKTNKDYCESKTRCKNCGADPCDCKREISIKSLITKAALLELRTLLPPMIVKVLDPLLDDKRIQDMLDTPMPDGPMPIESPLEEAIT